MACENLGPEAHESIDSAENPKKWLRISHVVESSSVRVLRGRVRFQLYRLLRRDSMASTMDYITWEDSHLDRSFVLNSNEYFIPILVIMPYLIL
jgi:hypothetical protein